MVMVVVDLVVVVVVDLDVVVVVDKQKPHVASQTPGSMGQSAQNIESHHRLPASQYASSCLFETCEHGTVYSLAEAPPEAVSKRIIDSRAPGRKHGIAKPLNPRTFLGRLKSPRQPNPLLFCPHMDKAISSLQHWPAKPQVSLNANEF